MLRDRQPAGAVDDVAMTTGRVTGRLLFAVACASAGGCGGGGSEDASLPLDAATTSVDAPGLDAPGLDALGLDALGLDAPESAEDAWTASPDTGADPCLTATCYFLAPDGRDDGAGTMADPWFSLNRAWEVVGPGDIVYLRGGTYDLHTKPLLVGRSGTAEARIHVWAYPGETPVLRPGPDYVLEEYVGIFFTGDYVHFRGLELTGFRNVDHFVAAALRAEASSHNVFERLNVHHNGSGMRIQDGDGGGPASDDNLVLDSDFHHNEDPFTGYGNADGLQIAFVSAGTHHVVRGCRAWSNSDDGFDFFANEGHVLVEDAWSWRNGWIPDTETPGGNGDGFKLGITGDHPDEILRTIRRSIAFHNRLSGFHSEEGNARMEVFHSIAYDNAENGFHFDYLNLVHVLRNDIALDNGQHPYSLGSAGVTDHCAYGGGGEGGTWANVVSAADFESLSPTGIDGPRGADGSLPTIPFLRLAAGSDLVDAGADLGDPFLGGAPDLGAFERE